ncbi:MAG: hypothetical protein HQL57_10430 [Magnetococcales bacterium]|nr:hypothetical protein [Magnetococcales bacterium]
MGTRPAQDPLFWCNWLSWILFSVAVFVAESAKPLTENFFHRILHVTVSKYWDKGLLRVCWVFLILTLVVSIYGLLLSSRRLRRKGDRLSVSLILVTIAAIGIMFLIP